MDKMGSMCGTHGTNKKCAKILGDKYERKRKLGQWENIVTVDTREISVGCVDWIFCSGEDLVAGNCENVNEH